MKPLTINFSDFNKKFKNIITNKAPALIQRGFAQAGMQLMRDAVMERPTVPIDEGWLRGSGSVFVNGKFVAESPSGKKGKAAKSDNTSKDKNGDCAVVGFNAPYAARLHEAERFKFREPSAGPKFLESKLIRHRNEYFKIIANIIKRGN